MLLHICWISWQQVACILTTTKLLEYNWKFEFEKENIGQFGLNPLCQVYPLVCNLWWITLQDRHWGWAGLDLQHSQSCWSLRCRQMLPLGRGRCRCSGLGSGCPKGFHNPQQLQVPLWLGSMSFKCERSTVFSGFENVHSLLWCILSNNALLSRLFKFGFSSLLLTRFELSPRRSMEQMILNFCQRPNTKWSSTLNRSAFHKQFFLALFVFVKVQGHIVSLLVSSGFQQSSNLHGKNSPVALSWGRQKRSANWVCPANKGHPSQCGCWFSLPTGWHGKQTVTLLCVCTSSNLTTMHTYKQLYDCSDFM